LVTLNDKRLSSADRPHRQHGLAPLTGLFFVKEEIEVFGLLLAGRVLFADVLNLFKNVSIRALKATEWIEEELLAIDELV
jgi:hypothetical protein